MSTELAAKPEIIVVTLSMDPHGGSEPGKGWWWSSALSEYFRLHVITREYSRQLCKDEPLAKKEGWIFHPTQRDITTWKIPKGYFDISSG